jgi:hypothetical protein
MKNSLTGLLVIISLSVFVIKKGFLCHLTGI